MYFDQPRIAERVEIIAMLGSVFVGYEGMKGAVPEYNVYGFFFFWK